MECDSTKTAFANIANAIKYYKFITTVRKEIIINTATRPSVKKEPM